MCAKAFPTRHTIVRRTERGTHPPCLLRFEPRTCLRFGGIAAAWEYGLIGSAMLSAPASRRSGDSSRLEVAERGERCPGECLDFREIPGSIRFLKARVRIYARGTDKADGFGNILRSESPGKYDRDRRDLDDPRADAPVVRQSCRADVAAPRIQRIENDRVPEPRRESNCLLDRVFSGNGDTTDGPDMGAPCAEKNNFRVRNPAVKLHCATLDLFHECAGFCSTGQVRYYYRKNSLGGFPYRSTRLWLG